MPRPVCAAHQLERNPGSACSEAGLTAPGEDRAKLWPRQNVGADRAYLTKRAPSIGRYCHIPHRYPEFVTKSVVLHIGTPKTGTTSIQKTLLQAKADGRLGQTCYPLWRGDHNHNRLGAVYWPFAEWSTWMLHHYTASPRQASSMRARYRNFILNELSAASRAILSAEALSMFPPPLVEQFRQDLESVGYHDFHVILYVRDPADYYLSITQQHLRVAAELPLVTDPASFTYPFREMTQTWGQAFPGRLTVRRYPTDPHHDVIDDFSAVLDEWLDISLPNSGARLNATLSAEAMQILQDYREQNHPDNGGWMQDVERLVNFLYRSADDVRQTRPELKAEVADVIRANHRADAEFISSRYGVDLGLRDSSPVPPPPTQTSTRPSTRQSWRVEDIVSTVDAGIVHRLLLRLANTELRRPLRKPPLPLRAARRAYRSIPAARRPERLAARFGDAENRPPVVDGRPPRR